MKYPDIQHIKNNPSLAGMADITQNIVYSSASGTDIKLTLLLPWGAKERKDRLPLIVFVQGSAWTFPDLSYEMGQMAYYAQNGYAVAMVTHRNCLDGHPFPAFLQDVKTSIRFLRSHAGEYCIDKSRVCIWGTSSGGNIAMLVGLTGNDPAYQTAEYAEESDAVSLVAECFGPTDLMKMLGGHVPEGGPHGDLFSALTRGLDVQKVYSEMSPVTHVKPGKKYPPFLLVHGDADEAVPYDQMVLMYHALYDQGADVRAICVDDAPHEGSFWSRELYDIILDYFREKL